MCGIQVGRGWIHYVWHTGRQGGGGFSIGREIFSIGRIWAVLLIKLPNLTIPCSEKGICLPTVFLWLLFVYIEAAVRLKEYKLHIDIKNLPFHLDLCRPFAAHW